MSRSQKTKTGSSAKQLSCFSPTHHSVCVYAPVSFVRALQRAREEEIDRKLREEKAAILRGERPGAPPPAAAASSASSGGGNKYVPSFKRGGPSGAPPAAAAAGGGDREWRRDEPRRDEPRPAGKQMGQWAGKERVVAQSAAWQRKDIVVVRCNMDMLFVIRCLYGVQYTGYNWYLDGRLNSTTCLLLC